MGETYQPFVIIEAVYMGWFTLEFFVRFLSSPSKVKIIQLNRNTLNALSSEKVSNKLFQIEFVRKLMNIVDLLAILPYYISLVFYRYFYSGLGWIVQFIFNLLFLVLDNNQQT